MTGFVYAERKKGSGAIIKLKKKSDRVTFYENDFKEKLLEAINN